MRFHLHDLACTWLSNSSGDARLTEGSQIRQMATCNNLRLGVRIDD